MHNVSAINLPSFAIMLSQDFLNPGTPVEDAQAVAYGVLHQIYVAKLPRRGDKAEAQRSATGHRQQTKSPLELGPVDEILGLQAVECHQQRLPATPFKKLVEDQRCPARP